MRIYFLLVFILLLTACGNQTIRPDKTDYMGLEQAQNFYLQQNFSQAASAYENLFKLYHKPEFAIYAADAWLQLGDYEKAQQLISTVHIQNNHLLNLIRAQLAINQGLYNFKLENITGELRPRYLKIKAQIDAGNHNFLSAALALIELSSLDSFNDYNNDIINYLLQVPEDQLAETVFNLDLTELQQGWLEATNVLHSNDTDAVKNWKSRWYTHPANVMFLSLNHYNTVAVLLPLSGKYRNISKSIQQGMIAALYKNNLSQQELIFFDTGSMGEQFSNAWYGAIESGAEFVIGPLEKKSITKLTQINSSSVPVLLLNQLESIDNPFGFYQFPLAQEDEVRNVANRLIAEDKKRIMILAPESHKGRLLAKTFEDHFNKLGGQIVSYAFYPESTHDYSREIKGALGLQDSLIRARTLQSILSTPLVNKPQIRPDIDAIFIIAKPEQARLIKPQLKFFQAENVPVFSTSQIMSAVVDTALDKDLNGIKFPQSAFIIAPQSLQNILNFNVLKVDSNKKYFAFGYDAVSLYPRLEWMQRLPNQKIQGLSGKLSVDNNGVVHRDLAWAQFKRGTPVLIPPIIPKVKNDVETDSITP
jgi:hypothetical protein